MRIKQLDWKHYTNVSDGKSETHQAFGVGDILYEVVEKGNYRGIIHVEPATLYIHRTSSGRFSGGTNPKFFPCLATAMEYAQMNFEDDVKQFVEED